MHDTKSLPCIACGANLIDVQETWSAKGNQPLNGLEFKSYGHYGTKVFDPMNGSHVIINVCDECLENALETSTAVIVSD